MQMSDVTALVYAHRGELRQHSRYREWLYKLLNGPTGYGVSDLAVLGFIQVVTNRKIFTDPTPLSDALTFADTLRHRPHAIPVTPGPRHWEIFENLCQKINATAGDVTDAHLAALAVEHDHVLVTEDRGFRRFPELRTTAPL